MVLGSPGDGRGEHLHSLSHASERLSPFVGRTAIPLCNKLSSLSALTELPTSSRAADVDNTSRTCSLELAAVREAA